jgi:hypothetical protein
MTIARRRELLRRLEIGPLVEAVVRVLESVIAIFIFIHKGKPPVLPFPIIMPDLIGD